MSKIICSKCKHTKMDYDCRKCIHPKGRLFKYSSQKGFSFIGDGHEEPNCKVFEKKTKNDKWGEL